MIKIEKKISYEGYYEEERVSHLKGTYKPIFPFRIIEDKVYWSEYAIPEGNIIIEGEIIKQFKTII